ncbi:MAG: hypothetical protein M3O61_18920 [Gemmatimonadota bacterium]|nr:hypothetical protein [Gemmatimonadota bacterium]
MRSKKSAGERPLRPGDVVEVKSAAEILATLDADGALDNMPFMPEMARHAGRRYTVWRRVDKACNTVDMSGSRRMHETVYLDDLRCDGSGHGRCQAACRIYWKEAWLRRVDDSAGSPVAHNGQAVELERLALAGTRAAGPSGDEREQWRCQATEALKASEHLKRSYLSQYWREFRNGNFRPLRFLALLARGFVMEVGFEIGLVKALPLKGSGSPPSPAQPPSLRPGDLVRVRPAAEIKATLDETGFNRGLSFDREMLPFCGKTFRVKANVDQIIDEETGRMLKIPKDSIVLDGPGCSGLRSIGRWFCARDGYPFWREAWLERVEEPDGASVKPLRVGGSAPEDSMPSIRGSCSAASSQSE